MITKKPKKSDEKAKAAAFEAKLENARRERKFHQLCDLQERVRAAVDKGRKELWADTPKSAQRGDILLQNVQMIVDSWVRLAIQDLDGDRIGQQMADRAAANRAA